MNVFKVATYVGIVYSWFSLFESLKLLSNAFMTNIAVWLIFIAGICLFATVITSYSIHYTKLYELDTMGEQPEDKMPQLPFHTNIRGNRNNFV